MSKRRVVLCEAQETARLLALVVRPRWPPRHCKGHVMERIAREDFRPRSS